MNPRQALVAAVLATTPALAQSPGAPPRGLRLLQQLRVIESDTLFVSRPTEIAVGPGGHLFVTEGPEARVLDIGPTGRIERVFGRKGQGPGEFMSPSTLAIVADSLLYVHDRVQRRLTVYSLATGKFSRSFPSPQAWPPALMSVGAELLVGAWDFESKTSLAVVGPGGEVVRREGVIPAIGLEYPLLIQGALYVSTFAFSGNDVYAMFEVSPSLYRWKRGARSATEIPIPKARRRGVDPSLLEQMFRDPANPRNADLFYQRSIPVALDVVAPGLVAALTMDYTVGADSRSVAFHLTVLDLKGNRACVDLPIPLSRASMSMKDPIPRLALRRDTLIVLEHGIDAQGESAPTLVRYLIEPARCEMVIRDS